MKRETTLIELTEWEIMIIIDWYRASHHFVGYSNCPRPVKYCHRVKKKLYNARDILINEKRTNIKNGSSSNKK